LTAYVINIILLSNKPGEHLKFRFLFLFIVMSCFSLMGETGISDSTEFSYRVLDARGACPPCGSESYNIIESRDKLDSLYAKFKKECKAPQAPEIWFRSITDLKIDFKNEAIVTMYEVIGTGGKPSLNITGPETRCIKVSIVWETGPPPHPPIATAACLSLAVSKSAVDRIEITPGGVLNKNREKIILQVSPSVF
jgi:hypothetical protein